MDVTFKSNSDNIISKSFRKSTAANTILHFDSCHPQHICKNIPYGEYIRARCNCSDTVDFSQEINNINARLKQRGYPEWVLKNAYSKVYEKDRLMLLKDRNKSTNYGNQPRKAPVVFSTAYSLEYKKICQIIKKHMPMLLYDPSLEIALEAGHELSPSLFTTQNTKQEMTWIKYNGSVGCGHKICICCSMMKKTKTITLFTLGNSFEILKYINCNSYNVIYAINCEMCKMQYVGHTSQKRK